MNLEDEQNDPAEYEQKQYAAGYFSVQEKVQGDIDYRADMKHARQQNQRHVREDSAFPNVRQCQQKDQDRFDVSQQIDFRGKRETDEQGECEGYIPVVSFEDFMEQQEVDQDGDENKYVIIVRE